MGVDIFFSEQIRLLKDSFTKLDKRFLHVLLLEILLIALIFSGLFFWRGSIMSIGNDIDQLQEQMSALGGLESAYGMQVRDEVVIQVATKAFIASMLLLLYLILVWTLVKNKIYNKTTNTSFSKHTYWRFLLVSIIWGIISFIVFMTLQTFVYIAFQSTFETSFITRFIVLMLLCTIFLALYWLTINLFTHLVTKGKIKAAIKGLYQTGIKGFPRFLVPLLFSLIAIILINLIMYIFIFMRSLTSFMISSAILLLLYFTWLRFYYTRLIAQTMITKKAEVKRTRQKRVTKKPVPKRKTAKKK
jgi:hypothetical protein